MKRSEPDGQFEALLEFLKSTRGFDFTGYKRASVGRRIRKRMHEVSVRTFADYQDYLEVHPEEYSLLFDTILINVTGFYRDPQARAARPGHGLGLPLARAVASEFGVSRQSISDRFQAAERRAK